MVVHNQLVDYVMLQNYGLNWFNEKMRFVNFLNYFFRQRKRAKTVSLNSCKWQKCLVVVDNHFQTDHATYFQNEQMSL
jgi:hypothetical protein